MPQEREDSNYDWLEYEEEVEVGPIGPRTLLDFCQGVVMRCASRYDDVGPLKYHQHPLFFQTMEPLQLAEIEDNSPALKKETNHLWKEILRKKDLETFNKYKTREEPVRWRKVYTKVLEKEQLRRANAATHMKLLYEQEASRKSERIVTVLDSPVPSVPGTGGWQFAGRRGGATAPKTLMGKIKQRSIAENSFFRPTGQPLRRPTALVAGPNSSSTAIVTPRKATPARAIVTRPPVSAKKDGSTPSVGNSGMSSPPEKGKGKEKEPADFDFFAAGGSNVPALRKNTVRRTVVVTTKPGQPAPAPSTSRSIPTTPGAGMMIPKSSPILARSTIPTTTTSPIPAASTTSPKPSRPPDPGDTFKPVIIDVDAYEPSSSATRPPLMPPPPGGRLKHRSVASGDGLFIPRKRPRFG